MPQIFRNPNLVDYFQDVGAAEPILGPYEAGQVLTLSFLKPRIDHRFWASLPVDQYQGLKKVSADSGRVMRKQLVKAEVPEDLAERIGAEAQSVLDQLLPAYEALFAGYEFTRRKVVWRLNMTRNESMHVDTYKEPSPDHFARMFVNLDDQPRIWKTSLALDELYDRYGEAALAALDRPTPNDLHAEIKSIAFGRTSRDWFDDQPRHVLYFDPGDVWIVDSRQVAHQIFYGRRAVSIDFSVDPASMRDPSAHYLARAEAFMAARTAPYSLAAS